VSQEQGLLSKQMMRRKTKKRFDILPEEAVLHVFDGQLDKGVKFSPETSFVAFFNSSFFTILARRSHLVSGFITNITSETRHLQQWFNITDTRTNTLLSDLAWYEVHKHEPNLKAHQVAYTRSANVTQLQHCFSSFSFERDIKTALQ